MKIRIEKEADLTNIQTAVSKNTGHSIQIPGDLIIDDLIVYKDSYNFSTNVAEGANSFGAISPDGTHFILTTYNNPFLLSFKHSGNTMTLIDAGIPREGPSLFSTFSKNGIYFAHGLERVPYLKIYSRFQDTYTLQFTATDTDIDGAVNGLDFSSNGDYLAVVYTQSPSLKVYKVENVGFTVLPTFITGFSCRGCKFSPDSNYLCVVSSSSPWVIVFKRNGDTFSEVYRGNSTIGFNSPRRCDFSPNGKYLAISNYSSPGFIILKRDGDNFAKINLDSNIQSYGVHLEFSNDGQYLAVADNFPPLIRIYKVEEDSDSFVLLENTGLPINETPETCGFSKDMGMFFYTRSSTKAANIVAIGKQTDTITINSSGNSTPNYDLNLNADKGIESATIYDSESVKLINRFPASTNVVGDATLVVTGKHEDYVPFR